MEIYMTYYFEKFRDQAVKLSNDFRLKKVAEQLKISLNMLACCHVCVLTAKKEEIT